MKSLMLGPITARFWVYHVEGWVRLALRDKETLWLRRGGACDEGYSFTTEEWSREGDTIHRKVWTTSRDCDGRYDTQDEYECSVFNLESVNTVGRPLRPDWAVVDSRQRDYTAEAEGY